MSANRLGKSASEDIAFFHKEVEESRIAFRKKYGSIAEKLIDYTLSSQKNWNLLIRNFRFNVEGFWLELKIKDGDVLAAYGQLIYLVMESAARQALLSGEHNEDLNTSNHIAEMFFDWEPCCDNSELFWRVCGLVYVGCGSRDKRWKNAFNRYDRPSLSDVRRITLFAGVDCATGKNYPRHFFEKLKHGQNVRVYRVFRVSEEDKVRKSYDSNSSDYFIQKDGTGYSYSLSQIVALHFSEIKLNKFIISKYSDRSVPNENVSGVVMTGKTSETQNMIGILGKYDIIRENIIGINTTEAHDEEEIISADDLKLLRYEPVTLVKFMSAQLLYNYKNSVSSKNGPIFWHLQDEKALLARARKFSERFFRNKELLAEYLSKSEARFNAMGGKFCEMNLKSAKGKISIKTEKPDLSVFDRK